MQDAFTKYRWLLLGIFFGGMVGLSVTTLLQISIRPGSLTEAYLEGVSQGLHECQKTHKDTIRAIVNQREDRFIENKKEITP